MKIALLIISLVVTGVSPKPWNEKSIRENLFIKIEFQPSFHESITFEITLKKETGLFVSKVFDFDSVTKFISYDSIILSKDNIRNFYKSINNISLLKIQTPNTSLGNDGITVNTTVVEDGILNKFSFWSPRRKDHPVYYKLLDAVFLLANNELLTQENYLERTQNYFDYGLGIKLKGKHPTLIKMHGSYSIDDDAALHRFFKRLPRNKPVILDMSNFGGMGTFAYDYFSDYDTKNQKVIWVTPGLYRQYFIKVGIDSNKMANDITTAQKIVFESDSR